MRRRFTQFSKISSSRWALLFLFSSRNDAYFCGHRNPATTWRSSLSRSSPSRRLWYVAVCAEASGYALKCAYFTGYLESLGGSYGRSRLRFRRSSRPHNSPDRFTSLLLSKTSICISRSISLLYCSILTVHPSHSNPCFNLTRARASAFGVVMGQ
jgi:hypothetical protein